MAQSPLDCFRIIHKTLRLVRTIGFVEIIRTNSPLFGPGSLYVFGMSKLTAEMLHACIEESIGKQPEAEYEL